MPSSPKKHKRSPLVAALDPLLPMALSETGIRMVFKRRLSEREVLRAFELFHLAATIETPDGYYSRSDYMTPDEHLNPHCPARGVYDAIAGAIKRL